jgi:rSAM/selenodomain-associated transferase 2
MIDCSASETGGCRLSIIVPVLDEADGIAAALTALAALREQGAELIVVDGESSDDTVLLAAPLADKVLQSPKGRACQMNTGAAASCGETLLFLHADTRLPAKAEQLVIEGLNTSEKAWGRFDVRIAGRSALLSLVAGMMNLRSRLTGIATGDQAIFVRREDFFAVGGYPQQDLMEDIALSSMLKRRSPPLCLRHTVTTSGRRWEKHGICRTILLMWRLRLLYWLGVPSEKLARDYR